VEAHLDVAIKALLAGIEGRPLAAVSASAAAPAAAKAAVGAENPLAAADTRVLIQTVSGVSRTVGNRLGKHLGRIVPLLLACMGAPSDADADAGAAQAEAANELRENCLQVGRAPGPRVWGGRSIEGWGRSH